MTVLRARELTISRGTIQRLIIALVIGVLAGLYCYFSLLAAGGPRVADDFTWHWLGARALIEGQNPYVVIEAGGQYNLDAPYVYPLTTALVVVPFALWLAPVPAAAVWVGVGSALLSWAVTREGYTRLLVFCSLPYLWAANSGQFSPILTASALLPALGWLAPIKPQLGIAALVYKPSRIAIWGAVAFVALSLLINPAWPRQWLDTLPHRVPGIYKMPLTILGGPILLLAALRWRRPEARLLLAMSLLPQNMLYYDQLILLLIPRTRMEYVAVGTLTLVGLFVASVGLPPGANIGQINQAYAPAILATIYLPCLLLVMRRKNEPDPPLPSIGTASQFSK